MDEELIEILARLNNRRAPDIQSVSQPTPEQGEIELTPEIARRVPVRNNARNGNVLTGITNFFSNPQAQNALLAFGRAFAQNQPNEPGTILANAGQQALRARGTRDVITAFEEGRPLTENPISNFADPAVITQLLGQRQQGEQFDEELNVRRQRFAEQTRIQDRANELRELGLETDAQIRKAALELDADKFNRTVESALAVEEANRLATEALARLRDAQAEALGQQRSGGTEDLSDLVQQTNEFIEILGTQEEAIQTRIEDINFEIEEASGSPFLQAIQGPTGLGDPDEELLEDLDILKTDLEDKLASVRAQQVLARNFVASRFGSTPDNDNGGGTGTDATNGDDTQEDETSEAGIVEDDPLVGPQGTVENPVVVDNPIEAARKPAGSVVQIRSNGNRIFRVLEDGSFQQVSQGGN